jgi:hypothetical protein
MVEVTEDALRASPFLINHSRGCCASERRVKAPQRLGSGGEFEKENRRNEIELTVMEKVETP